MQVGDLVRTPKINHSAADMAVRYGLGISYYDWEGKFGIIAGFRNEKERDYVEVIMQDTGKLCVFSPSTLTKVGR